MKLQSVKLKILVLNSHNLAVTVFCDYLDKKGVEVEETTFQSHTSLESAIADNHAQLKEINTVGYG